MKILLTGKGKKFYYKGEDLHTQYGCIRKAEIEKAKPGDMLKTNTGKEMLITDGCFMDYYAKIKRGAQIIPLKDIGAIVANTGINKNSRVVEAGSGSGALCCFLANIVEHVYTYEIREDFAKIVKKNIVSLGLKNVTQKEKDIYESIDEKDIDLVVLDLPEPWKVVPHAKALKHGGFLVSYSPCTPQVSDFTEAVSKSDGLIYIKTIEIMEREWDFSGRKVRPKSQAIGHSGFLSFVRRV